MNKLTWLFLGSLMVLAGCSSTSRVSTNNLDFLYRHSASVIHPEFQVFHLNDSVSEVHFKIATEELLYTRKSGDVFQAKVSLHYDLMESFENAAMKDSATLQLSDTGKVSPERSIIGSFLIPAQLGELDLLKIQVKDLYRQQEARSYLSVDKRSRLGPQNFLVRMASTGIPVFGNHFPLHEPLEIVYPHDSTPRLYGRYYTREFPLAPPPFSMQSEQPFDYDADSLFTIRPSDFDGTAFRFTMTQKGFYHFTADNNQKPGLTMFHFDPDFPETKTASELIQSLRFIVSRKEFEEMESHDSPKAALDKFWLSSSSNKERARELIRNYYGRVRNSNRYFSNHTEGWRTDRGMIYVVFGPPNVIYKSTNSESWIYGEENNYMSITFNFVKVDNPFSDNDFALSRSPIYKTNWYRAVDIWRQGRVLGKE